MGMAGVIVCIWFRGFDSNPTIGMLIWISKENALMDCLMTSIFYSNNNGLEAVKFYHV